MKIELEISDQTIKKYLMLGLREADLEGLVNKDYAWFTNLHVFDRDKIANKLLKEESLRRSIEKSISYDLEYDLECDIPVYLLKFPMKKLILEIPSYKKDKEKIDAVVAKGREGEKKRRSDRLRYAQHELEQAGYIVTKKK